MARRQSLPRLWLMTDERMGERLWPALERLPRGAGIVFRHYATPLTERRVLFERVRAVARRRRLVLVLAGTPKQAIAWRADGAHGRSPHRRTCRSLLRTAPAHDVPALHGTSAELLFLSPVFATRSHPGAGALGPVRFGLWARHAECPVVALGGMDPRRFIRLRTLGACGYAAIDAWLEPDAGQIG
ncbi:thiamine phosphate synthase [uncultured Sphingomonas sp.]|uniref:thiamine phosphate synthase n=1 Tax=uncultured Sphingomonas sp. TaxID=158754 RepID=UPI0025FF3D83|nr:thiamine phosphate synthase [uncultured Sphingomonas sp.]